MKKQIFVIWGILISVSFISSCMFSEQNLGDNYYYLPLYEARDVGYPDGSIIYKSTEKYSFSSIKIRGDVIRVDSNREFIVAIQREHIPYLTEGYSNIAKRKPLQYYIIAKKTDKVYGPFSKEEFIQKREELNITKRLRLEE